MFLSKKYKKFLKTNSYEHLSTNGEEVIDSLCDIFLIKEEDKTRKMLKKIMNKMLACEFIKNDYLPRENEKVENQLYITAKGNTIFEEFLKSSILFSIFRDELSFEHTRYNVKCTCDLTQEELNQEFFKYIEDFWDVEKDYFSVVLAEQARKDEYTQCFGQFILSQKMLKALEDSINVFYKENITENAPMKELLKKIKKLEEKIGEIILL